jgi:hypothetical protein
MDRATIRTRAQAVAQDAVLQAAGGSVPLVLRDPEDYDLAIDLALPIFSQARPNKRVVDITLTAAGFRQVLFGSGSLTELSGGDVWVPGVSYIAGIIHPFLATSQGLEPEDPNVYRVVDGPNDTVLLEWLDRVPAVGDVLRLAFAGRHVLDEAPVSVTAPGVGPTAALLSPTAAGVVEDGTHSYSVTFVTANGETTPSPASSIVTVVDQAVDGQVRLTGIPVSTQAGVTARRIYRTVAGNTGSRKLVGTLADNTTTVFTDNVADASLGATVPATNTAGGTQTVRELDREGLVMLTAAMLLQMAANRMVQNTGTSNLPNDIVDRRTPADIMRSAAKDLRALYQSIVAIGGGDQDIAPASGFLDLDTTPSWQRGFLWHPSVTH